MDGCEAKAGALRWPIRSSFPARPSDNSKSFRGTFRSVWRMLGLLAEDPYRAPSCQLEGYPELRRIHASKDYVIVYSILKNEVVVFVVRVAHRREVYRGL